MSVGEQLVTEKNIQLGRMRIDRGEVFSVTALNEDGVMLQHKQANLYFSNQELAELSLAYNYARKPSAITKNADVALVALSSYQLNKNTFGEMADFATHIKAFTDDKDKAIAQLDKAQLHWTIADVAEGAPSRAYRDSAFANDVLSKDLNALSMLLGDPTVDVAQTAVAYATAKLSERDAAFEHKELLTQAMHFALGKTRLGDIEKAIEDQAVSGALLHANTHWISKSALDLENKIVANNLENQGKL